ncbi:MAG TPA: sulfite exporter TauE/SafE family protein [Thermoanaerobaculales bacterium]|nr:sulfite exporter TauE/SafE family protein [Thermoanaerobaculales bacterium]
MTRSFKRPQKTIVIPADSVPYEPAGSRAMHFPISGVEVSPFVPPLVAFAISSFTSAGGVSGAILLLPFQVSVLGFTSPAVSATNQLFNIVAIPSGVARYVREGRMVWPLTWVVVAGTLPGVLIGALIRVRWLPDPAAFKVFAGAVLLYIGARFARDLIHGGSRHASAQAAEQRFQQTVRRNREQPEADGEQAPGAVAVSRFSLTKITYQFHGEVFDIATPGIFALAFVIGIVGGIYGIGGGAIIAPFLVAFFGLPVYTVAGAALAGTFITSVAGVSFYQAMAPLYPGLTVAPDWPLGLLFGLGGAAGMYCGARLQKHLPARVIKWILVAVILSVAASYLTGIARLL